MAHALLETVLEPGQDEPTHRGTLTAGPPPFFPEPPDDFGDEGGRSDDDGQARPPLRHACFAMGLFLGAETVFFAGLIGALLVYRLGSQTWPPPMMPSLPVLITGLNSVFLLCSAVSMWHAQRALRTGRAPQGVRFLVLTTLLGVIFLAVQGYEWVQLVRFGFTMASGVYGATFYTLIGCHALHVFGAVMWLLLVLVGAKRGRYGARPHTGLTLCGIYWYYVVALWPVLYYLVYLS